MSNSQPELLNCDSPIKKQIEKNYEAQFLINPLLNNEIEKKSI
jgi:hypothetical protein